MLALHAPPLPTPAPCSASVPPPQMEKHVSELVVAKAITAKIDRPAGVITFAAAPQAEEQLNGWAGNIGEARGAVVVLLARQRWVVQDGAGRAVGITKAIMDCTVFEPTWLRCLTTCLGACFSLVLAAPCLPCPSSAVKLLDLVDSAWMANVSLHPYDNRQRIYTKCTCSPVAFCPPLGSQAAGPGGHVLPADREGGHGAQGAAHQLSVRTRRRGKKVRRSPVGTGAGAGRPHGHTYRMPRATMSRGCGAASAGRQQQPQQRVVLPPALGSWRCAWMASFRRHCCCMSECP